MSATLANVVLDPFGQGIMQRALAEVVLLGIAGGLLGCWIVFHRLSYSAEALPHAMFPGLVGAALIGVPLVVGGAVGLLVAALAISAASRIATVDRDTSISVVFTSMFGLGVVLALSPDSPPGVQELLFGDVLGLTSGDVATAAGLTLLVVVALRTLHPRLLATAFDRDGARALGLRPGAIDLLLVALIAVATLICVQALGNLFVAATLVAPAAGARLFGRSVPATMALAVAIAIGCGIAGLYVSYYAHTATGASIAAVTVLVYLALAGGARLASARRPAPAG
ncbi:metal ABC transporter permease [Patulibacter defluvii]|uniref:metal ABC transporter permease n=1 Tax=Patulibacter defluvii TaxID=3095358 RepID=UPI002A75005A|nr:metal ABC transporter permease [Patulibacter sp. DM4]